MASISKQCSIENTFNFKRDVQLPIGHITALKIGSKTFSADLEVKKPTDEAAEKIVGAISDFYWEGGFAESLDFVFDVSVTNKTDILSLLHTDMKSILVEITFTLYDYDPEEKAFFTCVHSNSTALKGLIKTEGDSRLFECTGDQDMVINQPQVYPVMLHIVPEDTQQDVHVAVATSKKFVKPWGITRS